MQSLHESVKLLKNVYQSSEQLVADLFFCFLSVFLFPGGLEDK